MIVFVTEPSIEVSRQKNWFVYILECSDKSLYTGVTNNLVKRIKVHNSGKGAKYTRSRRPVVLKYFESGLDKIEAMKREYAIKQLTRKQKETLFIKEMREKR